MAQLPPHTVSLNVTIVQAEPAGKPLPYYETTRHNSRKRIYEGVKPRQYYRMEYKLEPNSTTYCTDIITYGIVAKIFTDQDERVIRSRNKNDLVYHGWKHNHQIEVTLDSLLELYNHTMIVRLWNSIDKVSPRARYDRPKAFRLPVLANTDESVDTVPYQPSNFPGVYHGLSVSSIKQARRKSFRPIPGEESREESFESLVASQKSQKIPPIVVDTSSTSLNITTSKLAIPDTSSTTISPGLKGISKQRLKQLQDEANERERINREGLVVLSIKLADLFGDKNEVNVSLSNSSDELKYFEVSVSLETPLMSEEQRCILNPMTIIIKDCTLPAMEKDDHERSVCVKYQFLNNPSFQTHCLPYSKKAIWNSSSVILLGIIKPEILLEYLRGPPLLLEIHTDSHNCSDKTFVIKDVLYGQLLHDPLLGTCICSQHTCKPIKDSVSQTTRTCTCTRNEQDRSPKAKLNMSCLLSGLTTMEFTLPVMNSQQSTTITCSKNYMEHDSQITVIIKISYPLLYPVISLTCYNDNLPMQRPLTPFGRLVYVVHISTNHMDLVNAILTIINDINAVALNLTEVPLNHRKTLLSTYKLTHEQISSTNCDIITGIHVQDLNQHIFMLEGLFWKGLHKIWNQLPHQSTHDLKINYFYNSDYTFSKRLYGILDVDIVHILLPQPLQCIVSEPELYLDDSIPKPAFDFLMNLHELQLAKDFGCVIRNKMFPSVDMVNSLNLYCSQQEVSLKDNLMKVEQNAAHSSANSKSPQKRTKSQEPLNNTNPEYENLLAEREKIPVCDKLTRNILKVHQLSERVRNVKKLHQRSSSEGGKPVSLYSSQTYNSTLMNKATLRKQLDPKYRYTYCQHYHNMTVEPVNALEQLKIFWTRSDKNKWITNEGFTCYRRKTQIQSQAHSADIHSSRKQDLTQPFVENQLHSHKLKPTVDWKSFTWQDRLKDFERYKPPPFCFGTNYPVTIHLAGDSRLKETKVFVHKEAEEWEKKIVVDQKQFNTLRQGLRTELSCLAASQQDKYKGLLKDEPIIPSAIAPTVHLRVDEIPVISTIRVTEMTTSHTGGYTPGDVALGKSLKLDCNILPICKT